MAARGATRILGVAPWGVAHGHAAFCRIACADGASAIFTTGLKHRLFQHSKVIQNHTGTIPGYFHIVLCLVQALKCPGLAVYHTKGPRLAGAQMCPLVPTPPANPPGSSRRGFCA